MVFGFMALQSAPEEIVKQLIAFLVVLALGTLIDFCFMEIGRLHLGIILVKISKF